MVLEKRQDRGYEPESIESLVADALRDENAMFKDGKWVFVTRRMRGRHLREMVWSISPSSKGGDVEAEVVEDGGAGGRRYRVSLKDVIAVKGSRGRYFCFLASSGRFLDPRDYSVLYMVMNELTRRTLLDRIGLLDVYRFLEERGSQPRSGWRYRADGEIYRRVYRGYLYTLLKSGSMRVVGAYGEVFGVHEVSNPSIGDVDRSGEFMDAVTGSVTGSIPSMWEVSSMDLRVRDYRVESIALSLRRAVGSGSLASKTEVSAYMEALDGRLEIDGWTKINHGLESENIQPYVAWIDEVVAGDPAVSGTGIRMSVRSRESYISLSSAVRLAGFTSIGGALAVLQNTLMGGSVDPVHLVVKAVDRKVVEVVRYMRETGEKPSLPIPIIALAGFTDSGVDLGRFEELSVYASLLALAYIDFREAIWRYWGVSGLFSYILLRSYIAGEPERGAELVRKLYISPEKLAVEAYRRGDISIDRCSRSGCVVRVFGRDLADIFKEPVYTSSDVEAISKEVYGIHALLNMGGDKYGSAGGDGGDR